MQAKCGWAKRGMWSIGLALACSLIGACREGAENTTVIVLTPQIELNGGCARPNPTFGSLTRVYPNVGGNVIGGMSQITGSQFGEKLFLTGVDGVILELEFLPGMPDTPAETEILAAGLVDSDVLSQNTGTAILSGLALVDPSNLVVVEHFSNTLLLVSTLLPQAVEHLVGLPDQVPGFADGAGGGARFNFPNTLPCELVFTAGRRLFVADAGNHAVREISIGPISFATTVAGSGAPGHADGGIAGSLFDTPTGLSVACDGRLLVTEVGTGGHYLRAISVGGPGFFGASFGSVVTLAGDGMALTAQGIDGLAQLASPVSPLVNSGGQAYWIDSDTGIVRRYDQATGLSDCPFFSDCGTANAMGGSLSGMGTYSLASTTDGTLYVLDVTAREIYRIDP